MNKDNRVYLEADVILEDETPELKEQASKIIELPSGDDKQPDLLYCSAVFVSTGENLNHAYFMGSELIMAEGSIVNKAMDVEHEESLIVGSIYKREFMGSDGKKLDLTELASKEVAAQDSQEIHIAIACVVYKDRFPNFAQEVADNKWKVSMECYFSGYDVKIGSLILDKKEAEVLGLASEDDSALGKVAKVMKNGVEVATGTVARVLRGICFSGCGFVKNPANPASIVLETAAEKVQPDSNDILVLNYDNNVTSDTVEGSVINKEESRDGALDDTTGICVSYKRRLYDKAEQVIATDWCTLYEKGCTAFSRDTTDPDCLRNKDICALANAFIVAHLEKKNREDRREELLNDLQAALGEAVKSKSH